MRTFDVLEDVFTALLSCVPACSDAIADTRWNFFRVALDSGKLLRLQLKLETGFDRCPPIAQMNRMHQIKSNGLAPP